MQQALQELRKIDRMRMSQSFSHARIAYSTRALRATTMPTISLPFGWNACGCCEMPLPCGGNGRSA